jgi:thiosulfate/3-mercaptopyruvate sulfurtransferase
MDALVSTEWLASELGAPDLRVLDCTVRLHRAGDGRGYRMESGRAEWEAGHIPGSVLADLTGPLSAPPPAHPFTMPGADALAAAMADVGVGRGDRVVVHDRAATMWATRVWWMLRAIGVDDVAVLDGGWKAWTLEGRPVSTDERVIERADPIEPVPRPGLFAGKDDVLAAIERGDTCVLNALSAAQHSGEELTYGRPGHLPGARNVYAADLVDPETGRYRPLPELAELLRGAGVAGDRVITYCGGGIAATSDAFVLHLLGHEDVSVYDGSLTEWIAEGLPLEV